MANNEIYHLNTEYTGKIQEYLCAPRVPILKSIIVSQPGISPKTLYHLPMARDSLAGNSQENHPHYFYSVGKFIMLGTICQKTHR